MSLRQPLPFKSPTVRYEVTIIRKTRIGRHTIIIAKNILAIEGCKSHFARYKVAITASHILLIKKSENKQRYHNSSRITRGNISVSTEGLSIYCVGPLSQKVEDHCSKHHTNMVGHSSCHSGSPFLSKVIYIYKKRQLRDIQS